jgi:hypothetical protein
MKAQSYCLREFHKAIPPAYDFNSKYIAQPSLFDLCTTLHLHDSALKANKKFTLKVAFGDLNEFVAFDDSGITGEFVRGLKDSTLEIPFICMTMDHRTPYPASFGNTEPFFRQLYEWAENSYEKLCTIDVLTRGTFDLDELLLLVRVIAFIGFSSSPVFLKRWSESLYTKLHCCLSVLSIYRYCSNVLSPILAGLYKGLPKQGDQHQKLLDTMVSSLNGWMELCSSSFEVCRVYFFSILFSNYNRIWNSYIRTHWKEFRHGTQLASAFRLRLLLKHGSTQILPVSLNYCKRQ